MNIAFRVDAATHIGSGHVMRCLTLADELKRLGAKSLFISRECTGNLIAEITRRGHKSIALPAGNETTAEISWLGASEAEDARLCLEALQSGAPDWLVVDHYGISEVWESELRGSATRIAVIDDLANRAHNCDLLIDQTLGRQPPTYRGLVPSTAQLLLGTQYALLRPEFHEWREQAIQRERGGIQRVLITMGGVDADNITLQVLQAIHSLVANDVIIDVVLGQTAAWADSIKLHAEKLSNVYFHVGVRNMAELMAQADLCIGAAGTTSWERCALGLPTIQVVLAENQKSNAEALSKAGAAVLLPLKDIAIALPALLGSLFENPHRVREMSATAGEICDAQGVSRVANNLLVGFS